MNNPSLATLVILNNTANRGVLSKTEVVRISFNISGTLDSSVEHIYRVRGDVAELRLFLFYRSPE